MGCCLGKGAEVKPDTGSTDPPITPADGRKCRDIFWLVLYILFWLGMLCIGGFSFYYGDLNKIIYGVDSMGNICGSENNWNGTSTPNLVNRTYLYYLDPTQLYDALNLPWAKTICVKHCPGAESVCELGEEACTNGTQYRCPYYMAAEKGLYGHLPGVTDPRDTEYYDELLGTTLAQCSIDTEALGSFSTILDAAMSAVSDVDSSTAAAACGAYFQASSSVPSAGPCYPVFAQTVSYMNRCFPDPSVLAELVEDSLNTVQVGNQSVVDAINNEVGSSLQVYVTDAYRAAIIVVGCGIIGSVVLSLIWMVILRFFAGCMAWTVIVLINLIAAACTILCFQKSGLLGVGAVGQYINDFIEEQGLPSEINPATSNQETWEIVAWVSLAATVLLMLFTILMCKRVKVAVACLKVASQAVGAMPSVLLFPLLPLLTEIIFLLYWLAVCALLYSTGEIVMKYKGVPPGVDLPADMTSTPTLSPSAGNNTNVDDVVNLVDETAQDIFLEVTSDVNLTDEECYLDPNCAYQLEWNNTLQYLGLYHLFGLLWTLQFIIGYGYVVIAGAIANFYWYSNNRSEMPALPVCKSMCNAFKSLGSIALGSLIIAIIQFIRIILEYVDRKTKEIQEGNPLLKYFMSCMKCCMWCLEKIMKFINRNTYIMVALKGTSYCTSAVRAIALILGNALRLTAVNTVGDLLIFLGKLCVVGACAVMAFFISGIDYFSNPVTHPETFLSSPLVPIVLTVVFSWFVATVFFQVYEMAVDTILLCFCEDCENNNGEPQFAPEILMKAIGSAAPAASKQEPADS